MQRFRLVSYEPKYKSAYFRKVQNRINNIYQNTEMQNALSAYSNQNLKLAA